MNNFRQIDLELLSEEELVKIEGGLILEVIAIAVVYCTWAASFCYNLGKD